MEALLQNAKLVKNDGTEVSISSLSEKTMVGLYFSAHWCPPCRGFTPQLATWYEEQKQSEKGAEFEIVFVSSDRDNDSFQAYFNTMPWLALDFSARDVKEALGGSFGIQGIPTLVWVNKQGEEKSKNGRADVSGGKAVGDIMKDVGCV